MASATKAAPPSEPQERERGMIADVLTYPVRSGGLLMIGIGAVFSIVLSIGMLAPIMGLVAAAFALGFFASYYLDIINTTVNGKDDPPDWPSVGDFMDDIVSPLLKTLGVGLIAGAPLLLTLLIDETSDAREIAEMAASAWVAFYTPMAVLGLVMHGHLGGSMPHRVLPAIVRTLPGYVVVVAMSGGLLVLSHLAEELGPMVPYVGTVLIAAVSLYLLMAEARLIGLLYRAKRDQIGWG
jgi:hypothetical protein